LRIYSFSRFVCRDLRVFVPNKRARLAEFRSFLIVLFQGNAVEVVERHLVPVSAEDVHAAVRVEVGSVAITGCRLSTDHAELSALSLHGGAEASSGLQSSLLSLPHALVVSVEGGVRIGDDE